MDFFLDVVNGLWARIKARRAARAASELAAGQAIIDQAQREADEMRAAAEAAEARKRLDAELSGVPIVPVEPPKP